MKPKVETIKDSRVKKKAFSWKEFALTYLILLLLVGVQMGLIVAPVLSEGNPIVHISVIMIYWVIVAFTFTYITNKQIRDAYDKPMRRLSGAAKEVAEGDFSVYVEPFHTPDKYDYIDVMITDFNTMVQELGSIETLKNDFVSNVSHEIKTPLTIIKNYTTLLQDKNISEEDRAEYTNIIVKTTDNLSTLVSNILRLNKLDNQEIEYPVELYNLSNQLAECILGFESIIETKNLQIEIDMEDDIHIMGDEDMMAIVWNNIVSNAIKFTPDDGTISLSQRSDGETVSIEIRDSGCGMSDHTLKHIFDKFYQGDTSHSGQGNGLGLALAFRIVEKAHGTISVSSQINHGSSFKVTLPLK